MWSFLGRSVQVLDWWPFSNPLRQGSCISIPGKPGIVCCPGKYGFCPGIFPQKNWLKINLVQYWNSTVFLSFKIQMYFLYFKDNMRVLSFLSDSFWLEALFYLNRLTFDKYCWFSVQVRYLEKYGSGTYLKRSRFLDSLDKSILTMNVLLK